jgi:hypothetical protein
MKTFVPDLFALSKGARKGAVSRHRWCVAGRFATAILLPGVAFAAIPAKTEMLPFAAIQPSDVHDKAADDRSALHCTADRKRCAQLTRQGENWTLTVYDRPPGTRGMVTLARYLVPSDGDVTATIWPHMVAVGGSAREMYGVEWSRSQGYSGGGSSATTLSLGIFDAKSPDMVQIASVPGGFSAMIRACFSERDMKKRAGACHDEYDMKVSLTLDPSVPRGIPRFVYTTRAKTYPGRVSRSEDSLTKRPLTKRDLVWAVDRVCSYRRMLAFDSRTGGYAFDAPPPECADYTEQ